MSVWAISLEDMRMSQTDSDTRVVFDFNEEVKYKVFKLHTPERLVIDLKNTTLRSGLDITQSNNNLIKKIRHAPWKETSLRIVFDLKQPIKYIAKPLQPTNGLPYRLIIDIHADGVGAEAVTLTPTPKPDSVSITPSKPIAAKPAVIAPPKPPAVEPEPKKVEVIKPKPTPKPEPKPVVQEEPKKPTVSKSTKTITKRDIVIAIDPGHGGKDSGALGNKGTKEKDIVLAISKRLAKLVNDEPGMRAYLTRDRDVFIPLRHRIKRARDNNADMFISIHADAFKNTKAKGASVFVLSEKGASSEAAQLLADKENAADLAGGLKLIEGKDDLLAEVLIDLSQTASLEGSLEVGNTILSGLKRVGNVHKKHVESAAFVVLKSPDIPSVLVETAFISNPAEEKKLKSSSHQNKLARAIMSGIRNYFLRNPLPGTEAQRHIVSRGDTLSTIAQRYQVSIAKIKSHNKLADANIKIGQTLLIP